MIQNKWFPLLLFFASIAIFMGLKSLKSAPPKAENTASAPLVKAVKVSSYSGPIKLYGSGAVRSVAEVTLTPQISGVIKETTEFASTGANFNKGDVLFLIEEDDYLNRLKAAKAEVLRQKVMLQTETYEAEIAKEEWKEYSNLPVDSASPLTLRQPQKAMAEANYKAALANYDMAKLNYKRTKIRAPFSGKLKQRLADKGQFVAPGNPLATIFSTDKSEIHVSIQPHYSVWLEQGKPVTLRYKNASWEGKLARIGGSLNEKTRLMTVVIEVDQPYQHSPALLNGLYVDVELTGKTVDDVFLIERHWLRNETHLWVLSDGKLRIREAEVLHHGKEGSYVRATLNKEDQIITSNIEVPVDGLTLRTH